MIAKQTLGAAAGAGAIVLAPKVAVAAELGAGYDYAGDVISRAMGLSDGEPDVGKSLVVGGVAGVTAPFFLPLSTLGGSTAGKIVVGGYNSVLAGMGAFAGTAITNPNSSPDLSGGIGAGIAAAGEFTRYIVPGQLGTSLGYIFQIVPGPMQSAIEKEKIKEKRINVLFAET